MPLVEYIAPILLAASPQAVPPPGPPPPPPAPATADPLPEQQRTRLVTFQSGAVTCAGQSVAPMARDAAMPSVQFAFSRASTIIPSVKLAFSISADGRPIDIHRVDEDDRTQRFGVDTTDIEPALATWQFADGAPRSQCTVTFAALDQPLDQAPRVSVIRAYLAQRGESSLRRQLFDQLRPIDADCYSPHWPEALVHVNPDFRTIPQRPGTSSFTMVAFDLDRHGRPVDVHVDTSGGNKVLDARSVEAVRRSRFASGARYGCLYPYWRRATDPIPAPPPPDVAAYRPSDADCEGHHEWARYPVLTYPQAFNRRNVEGWAIVRYDVAPWGELGNIQVLASEPADGFGQQAIEVMRSAMKAPIKRGLYGCVQLVKFKMAKNAD
jgi:TonB family protein